MRIAPAPSGATGFGLAHAKAILFGEHAVVHGTSAIAMPVHGLRVRADVLVTGEDIEVTTELNTGQAEPEPVHIHPVLVAVEAACARFRGDRPGLRVHITSDVPYGRGLGSSAAVSAAVGRAVADLAGEDPDPEVLHEVVQMAERVAHGNPSGLDARTVVSHDVISFRAGHITRLEVGQPLTFVLADSGQAGSTATAVAGVQHRLITDPAATQPLIDGLGALAETAVADLVAGDVERLGRGMYEAHGLLQGLQVSTPSLDRLVAAARSAGSPGAKLTGGGLGGCILALAQDHAHAEALAGSLAAAGATRTWTTEVPPT